MARTRKLKFTTWADIWPKGVAPYTVNHIPNEGWAIFDRGERTFWTYETQEDANIAVQLLVKAYFNKEEV